MNKAWRKFLLIYGICFLCTSLLAYSWIKQTDTMIETKEEIRSRSINRSSPTSRIEASEKNQAEIETNSSEDTHGPTKIDSVQKNRALPSTAPDTAKKNAVPNKTEQSTMDTITAQGEEELADDATTNGKNPINVCETSSHPPTSGSADQMSTITDESSPQFPIKQPTSGSTAPTNDPEGSENAIEPNTDDNVYLTGNETTETSTTPEETNTSQTTSSSESSTSEDSSSDE